MLVSSPSDLASSKPQLSRSKGGEERRELCLSESEILPLGWSWDSVAENQHVSDEAQEQVACGNEMLNNTDGGQVISENSWPTCRVTFPHSVISGNRTATFQLKGDEEWGLVDLPLISSRSRHKVT